MPRYRTTVPTFIAPDLVPPGTIFTVGEDYEPSLTLEPLDDAAEEAIAKVAARKPQALINPVDALTVVGGQPGESKIQSIEAEKPTGELTLGSLAAPGKAKPGLSEGGKALDVK